MRLTLHVVSVLLAVASVSAAPADGPSPEESVRRGNALFAGGDLAAADHLYAAAEERATDPGLVAFNRAAVLFARGEFRDAELHYLRSLADASVPPDRRKRALFNRGVCLLKRGGPAAVYRSAVACFEGCLDAPAAAPDPALDADARHNLEVAKVLWGQARAKEATPPKPNDPLPDEPIPLPAKGPAGDDGGDDPGGAPAPQGKPEPTPGPGPKDQAARPADGSAPGTGSLPVIPDAEVLQPLSPEDTRALLRRAADRLEKDRQAATRLLAGPERANVRDW